MRLFDGCAKFTFCRSETESQWRRKRLHSELRICLGENQNKRKNFSEKFLHQEHFLVMLHPIKNFRELRWVLQNSYEELSKILDHRLLLTEAAIEIILENICTFYDRQILLLKDTMKAFDDFKNKQKSVWCNVFWYLKLCIFSPWGRRKNVHFGE